MTHSHAQRLPVTCSECGQWFASEVWLIIDADERPAGSPTIMPCHGPPTCSHSSPVATLALSAQATQPA